MAAKKKKAVRVPPKKGATKKGAKTKKAVRKGGKKGAAKGGK